ncbi:MAG: putative ABC transporter permease [Clostridia bacterium]|nr:putative ABC transporter permease [Clostridia bacterium]
MKKTALRTAPSKEERKLTLSGYVWIFTLVSFIGWCFEKIGRYYVYPPEADPIRDRGFLTLPFCAIYGTCVVAVGFLFGSPNYPSRIWKRMFRWAKRVPAPLRIVGRIFGYFLAVTLVATLVELVAGLIFQAMGNPLWNYHERWGNLWGVICPSFSLIWGLLGTLLMTVIWKPLCLLIGVIPEKAQNVGAWIMVGTLLSDLAFNLIYVAVTGHRFYFL